jgi:hypothetical protein
MRQVFLGHPVIQELAAPGPLAIALAAAVLLPAGIHGKGRFPRSSSALISGLVGLAALGFALGGIQLLTGAGAPPLLRIAEHVAAPGAALGDQVAAVLLGVALLGALLGLPVLFSSKPRPGLGSAAAFLYSGSVTLALLVLAMFVSTDWRAVLEPLKLAAFLGAAVLAFPQALGTLLGTVGAEIQEKPR